MRPETKVTITWFEGSLYVTPWISLLETELQFELRQSGPSAKQAVYTTENLFTRLQDGGMVSPGMFHRITKLLTSFGIKWVYDDHLRPKAELMPPPVWSPDLELRHRQEEALSKITTAEFGGIIECCTAYGKSFIITEVCKMYPDLNIVVISARASVVAMLHKNLSEALTEPVGKLCAGSTRQDASRRVVVSTCASILKAPLSTCDLVLFDEVHNLGGNQIAKHLMANVARARMFGLTATLHRGDNALKVIEALFGQTIMKVKYQEAVDNKMVVPMYFKMMDVPDAQPLTSCRFDVVDKRRHYWQNKARNLMIAKVATYYAMAGKQLLVMVETLEHAAHLHKLLPSFQVVHYGNLPDHAYGYDPQQYKITPKQKKQIEADFAAGTLRCAISTMTWREGVNFVHLSVVIRADGSVSPVACSQIPGRASRLCAGKESSILIDFADAYSPWSADRAKRRKACYKQEKWQEV